MSAIDPATLEREALRREVERLRVLASRERGLLDAVLNQSPHGIIICDAQGRLTLQNRAAERIWAGSATADSVAEWGQYRAFHPDGRPYEPGDWSMARCLSRREVVEAEEVHFQRFDGTHGILLGSCAPILGADGTLLGAVSVFADITRFKEIEERLAARERELERLYDRERRARAEAEAGQRRATFLAEASALLGASLDYQATLNQAVCLAVPRLADWCAVDMALDGPARIELAAVAHVDPDKVALARELRRRYPPDPGGPHGAAAVLRSGRPELYEEIPDALLVAACHDEEHLRIVRALGIRSAMVVPISARGRTLGAITFVYAESGGRYTGADLEMAVQLGQRAGLAIDNARLYREATEAVSLRDEFLSVAGHELRTPLSALLLQVQAVLQMARQGADHARMEERLAKAVRNAERFGALINQLLDVSRLTAGCLPIEREELDLTAVVGDLLSRSAEELARAGCEVRLTAPPQLCGQWDRVRIEQILANLLSNAMKYGRGRPIEVCIEELGEAALLTVRDHGIGIAPEHQGRIFERFERAVSLRHFGGLGLGLWIVRQIVDAHGGRISVASTPGEGATFHIALPRRPPAAP